MKARPMPETPGAPERRDSRSLPRRSRSGGSIDRDAPLYGALDLGTNNCRLLIARPARDGFRVVDSFSRIVRLGESLSRTGRLDDRAMDRAYDALALCAERVVRKGVDPKRLTAVATQACRMAENGPAFVERVRRGTGLRLRIIDPSEEAALSVAGCLNLFDPRAEAVLVIDVGGGSTELSWLMKGARGIETVAWMSAPLGVVSLAERHPEPEGETSQWYEAMVADFGAAIASGGPGRSGAGRGRYSGSRPARLAVRAGPRRRPRPARRASVAENARGSAAEAAPAQAAQARRRKRRRRG